MRKKGSIVRNLLGGKGLFILLVILCWLCVRFSFVSSRSLHFPVSVSVQTLGCGAWQGAGLSGGKQR